MNYRNMFFTHVNKTNIYFEYYNIILSIKRSEAKTTFVDVCQHNDNMLATLDLVMNISIVPAYA